MLSALLVKTSEQNVNNFIVGAKRKLLKACADIAILSELNKPSRLSGADIVYLFRSKYGMQMSPGTVYPILQRMEKKETNSCIASTR